ncbi:MAG: hypothetical protein CMD66_03485 [Gammaproteobacteria bacterium]|nr:hypothetical protein [Gammaproteobacteria bacterium]
MEKIATRDWSNRPTSSEKIRKYRRLADSNHRTIILVTGLAAHNKQKPRVENAIARNYSHRMSRWITTKRLAIEIPNDVLGLMSSGSM